MTRKERKARFEAALYKLDNAGTDLVAVREILQITTFKTKQTERLVAVLILLDTIFKEIMLSLSDQPEKEKHRE